MVLKRERRYLHFPRHRISTVVEGLWIESICGSSVKAARGRKCLLPSPNVCMPFPAAWGDFPPAASLQNMGALG